ncbi:MAG: N-formylglutamate amidohydrolase [Hyphomicrobiales bacterium]|nr:N-formylglutamate amidohydrolase [Hyphomicrobiales bacterium]
MADRNAQSRDTALAARFEPVEEIAGDLSTGLILICDHAENALPEQYGRLGLPDEAFGRHIAYDIGAGALARTLARRLGVPAVLASFSRLLIDPNRGEDDPTLIVRLSDGVVVPGNALIDDSERANRISRYYRPYHDAIGRAIDRALSRDIVPAIVSIHSFTANWRGFPRPWHVGILWDRDPRLAAPLIEALRADGDIVVGDNEPYTGRLRGDTLYRHGTGRGLAHALIELRQDLIAAPEGVTDWAGRLAPILSRLALSPDLREIRDFGSQTQ